MSILYKNSQHIFLTPPTPIYLKNHQTHSSSSNNNNSNKIIINSIQNGNGICMEQRGVSALELWEETPVFRSFFLLFYFYIYETFRLISALIR